MGTRPTVPVEYLGLAIMPPVLIRLSAVRVATPAISSSRVAGEQQKGTLGIAFGISRIRPT